MSRSSMCCLCRLASCCCGLQNLAPGVQQLAVFNHYLFLKFHISLGRRPKKKNVYFWALPESGGGEAPARIFWPFFYSIVGPKNNQFLLKSHNICMFFGHVLHHYHQNHLYHNQNYHLTIIVIVGTFFHNMPKMWFLMS